MVYGTYNELVTGAYYKPTNITGGPYIVATKSNDHKVHHDRNLQKQHSSSSPSPHHYRLPLSCAPWRSGTRFQCSSWDETLAVWG